MSVIPAELLNAYQCTSYRVHADPSIDLWIGQGSQDLKSLLLRHNVRTWAFITAANPFSEALVHTDNAQRHIALTRDVSSLGYLSLPGEGIGQDPSWAPEQSLLVLGISLDVASSLGRHYDQNAIVYGDDEIPTLILLR